MSERIHSAGIPGSAVERRSAARPGEVSTAWVSLLVGGLVVSAILLRAVAPERIAWLKAAIIVFGALVIQATPFVLIGAFAAALIEVFVPPSSLESLAKLPRPLQLPAAGLAGIAFPICECGSVPVARRLMAKGLMPGAAITFMLAAPVLNPVVIASTYVAYRGRSALWTMVLGRFGLGLVVAIAVGWVLGDRSKEQMLRSARTMGEPDHVELGRPEPRWRTFFVHLGNDFLFMARFLLLGAAVAAVVQTFLPQSIVAGVAGVAILDAVVMMGLAFILSLCSESDAFIAASFTQFGPASQLGVPGLRADGRPQARRALRRNVLARRHAHHRHRGGRDDPRRCDVAEGAGRMSDTITLSELREPVSGGERRFWSRARVGGGLVLGAWAGMFWFLLLTGRINLYLSTRTQWVVPVGAALLSAAAVGRIVAARVRRPEPLRRRERSS